ncbi:MAG: alanine--tRNA ligase [Candidatus Methanomethylicaceae archaeon]
MIVGPEAYRLQFFIDNGFQRKECKSCRRHFWTLDPDRELCGDSPCVPFSFLNDPPTKRKFTIKEMREEFLSFFEKRGHHRVRRYPVVARWRDDIFLTIASIACFQPHVTSGEVPPPFNPLTISQPCIRLNDLDNVGKTGGRHLSIFEMMAHHAFNSSQRQIYWKEETVKYHHELLTKDLGVPGKEVTYIEHWWEGGGDAGPDLEGIVRGMEVSTLVFMQYSKVGNDYKELPLKIVDTGYGLERFTWLSQGTPTAFQAVYGSLFDKFTDLAKVQLPDPKVLSAMTKYAGIMNVVDEGSLKAARKHVADLLGTDASTLERQLEPIETITAILDHTKTLTFMLSDGIVPSNVQAGYLARLLVRRLRRMMDGIGMKVPLSELLLMQISYWKDQFPELTDNMDYVAKVADLEVNRYLKTLEQGRSLVLRLVREEGIAKAGILPLEKLIELYDSNGLPPEIVKEVSEPQGVKVEIPDTFDTIVADRHSNANKAVEAQPGESRMFEGLPSLPPTGLTYYTMPKLQKMVAGVLYADGKRIILDKTIFYPEGGGQMSDTGRLVKEGAETKVFQAQKHKGMVIHFVESGTKFKAGDSVECDVDWQRRMSLARHHSSTHILLGAARRVLGGHVWQMGAQKSPDRSRIDISHYEKVTASQLREIEFIANRVVSENRPINTAFMERNTAEQKYGFGLYQGGVIYGSEIRIVEIPGWDAEACGGIHCATTGEIGIIKIIKSERIQDGVERIEFVSGEPALKYIQNQESMIQEVSRTINTPVERFEKAASKLVEDLAASKKEAERLRRLIANEVSPSLIASGEKVGAIKLVSSVLEGVTGADLLPIASRIVDLNPSAVAILASKADGSVVILAGAEALKAGADAGRLAGEFTLLLNGRGGGRSDVGQGRVPPAELEKFAVALSKVKASLHEKKRTV